MRAFSNSDTVGVHVTSACNRRCAHCYQRDFTREMDLDAVCRTLEGMSFANILAYGGEPLVRPRAVRALMDRWPGKGFFIATSGSVPIGPCGAGSASRAICERADGIFLTLESFFLRRQPPFRRFGPAAFRAVMDLLDSYADKILILHNVYPRGNDPTFCRMARLRGLRVAVYPVIVPGATWDMDEETFRSLRVFPPLTRPKLRVLEDGTPSRDMRGIHNGDGDLPMSDRCRACDLLPACPFVSMFPHFCHDVIRDMARNMAGVEPWFCNCVRTFAGGRDHDV